jgi:hypothetical protein
MKKKYFEILLSLFLLAFVSALLFTPIYYFGEGNYAFFPYCLKAGASVLSYGGGILLFLLITLAILKIVFAFRFELSEEKNEQYNFALYSIWIILGLGYSMVCFASQSLIAFTLGIALALSGLLAFFLDYHFYGQD